MLTFVPAWLCAHPWGAFGLPKELRKRIYAKLSFYDRALVGCAHSLGVRPHTQLYGDAMFQMWCVRAGHIRLLEDIARRELLTDGKLALTAAATGQAWAA
jgi:hypothetical protein